MRLEENKKIQDSREEFTKSEDIDDLLMYANKFMLYPDKNGRLWFIPNPQLSSSLFH